MNMKNLYHFSLEGVERFSVCIQTAGARDAFSECCHLCANCSFSGEKHINGMRLGESVTDLQSLRRATRVGPLSNAFTGLVIVKPSILAEKHKSGHERRWCGRYFIYYDRKKESDKTSVCAVHGTKQVSSLQKMSRNAIWTRCLITRVS
jgi:hypothetical protein